MQAEVRAGTTMPEPFSQRAGEAATDDYDACVAAHYLARQQQTAQQILRWNQECLDRADRVGDERVLGDLGTEADRERLISALGMVHASRSLPDEDQVLVSQVIGRLRGKT